MAGALIKYDAACRALAEAKSVDEAKDILDRSEAMRVYARQARNRDLEIDAAEIRIRAERRLGELIKAQKDTVGLNKGSLRRGTSEEPRDERPTLSEAGIDKKLSARAQKMAAVPEAEFEASLGQWRTRVAEETERVTTNLLKQGEKTRGRDDKLAALAAKIARSVELLGAPRYGVILADPPWAFEPYSRVTGMDRAADNHYPTMSMDEIARLPVPAADDCVLFLWATAPCERWAHWVMEAWGFGYRSQLVWVKVGKPGERNELAEWREQSARPRIAMPCKKPSRKRADEAESYVQFHGLKIGTGYWARNAHEILLIGVKGHVPAPEPGTQPDSVIFAPVGRHSEKPHQFHAIIEAMFPTLPKLEMFARQARPGWDAWGAEIEASVEPVGNLGVIPAEAGIQAESAMDPGLRRGDAMGAAVTEAELQEYKALGAMDAGLTISGPILGELVARRLIDAGELTGEGRARLAELEARVGAACDGDAVNIARPPVEVEPLEEPELPAFLDRRRAV